MSSKKKKEEDAAAAPAAAEEAPVVVNGGGEGEGEEEPKREEPRRAQRATSNVFALFNQSQIQEFKEVRIKTFKELYCDQVLQSLSETAIECVKAIECAKTMIKYCHVSILFAT